VSDKAAPPQPTFFETPAALEAWFAANHEQARELWVGFRKKGSGLPSITWPEAVDAALCVGWIDGVTKGIDATSYAIRFTPRKPRSIWSAVNIARVAELEAAGRMRPAGLAAFARRAEDRSRVYAYEQAGEAALAPADEERFRANPRAWEDFQARPAWYRKTAIWQIVSAKREETRRKRLDALIDASAQGRPIAALDRRPKRKSDAE
jgi:uncharacterized protein YdeI (YjbR/CyaY-like superfamily)